MLFNSIKCEGPYYSSVIMAVEQHSSFIYNTLQQTPPHPHEQMFVKKFFGVFIFIF